ncbi:transferase [Sulfuracidifex metallicus]|uniref:transferase n=1 Tax=Sulfuracidifex metallicus TaxID=47303 RepID=UPI0022739F93|nr:transferase [Sulfuracidifex metallicus]MCY0850680.1 transferase [Sulfuracidifex metallicus]
MVGVGKIPIDDAKVYLDGSLLLDAKVYVHIKGYSRARVTHVDVEHQSLKKVILPRHSDYPSVKWGSRVEISVKGHVIVIESETLGKIIKMDGNLYVGGKGKGIFLGFHKDQIRSLESFGESKGFPPIKRSS